MDDDVLTDGSAVFNYRSYMNPRESKIKSLWPWAEPEDVPLRISISGVAGTGKRKLAKSLSRKLDIPAISGIPRTVGDMGGLLNKRADLSDEFMIFMAQFWEQQEYSEYVSAGSLIDLVAHIDYLFGQSTDLKNKSAAHAAANVINMIASNAYTVYFYLPFRNKPKPDGVRSVDEKYLREIDRLTRFYLDAFDIDYFPLDGTHSENSELAMSYMEDFSLLDDRDL
jgi:hypothetical protein